MGKNGILFLIRVFAKIEGGYVVGEQQKKVRFIALLAIVIVIGSFYSFGQKSSVSEHTSSGEALAKGGQVAEEKDSEIVVYISGAVSKPGVYRLLQNARVVDLIAMAGGLAFEADESKINMAQQVKDGMHIHVTAKERRRSEGESITGTSKVRGGDKISINSGEKNDLDTLPGVGPALAQRIIEYRQTNGSFNDIEELKKVPGIGASKFEKLKEKIIL